MRFALKRDSDDDIFPFLNVRLQCASALSSVGLYYCCGVCVLAIEISVGCIVNNGVRID